MPQGGSRPGRIKAFAVALATACAAALPVLATAAPADAASGVHYVALGDSYSSGLGAGDYIAASGSCDRSTRAYSALWDNANKPASYTSVACAGATTSTVLSSQISALSTATTLVSITIGGNDVGFESVMETCVLFSTSTCVRVIDAAESETASQLPGELDGVLNAITPSAPNARVVVLGYPHLYDLQIQAAAFRHDDVFGDVRTAFAANEICDSASWLHAVNIFDLSESYHPTAAGQAGGYLPVFTADAG